MDDLNEVTADALELLMLNQNALGAAVEEISLWVRSRGEPGVHANVMGALRTLDQNAESITSAIEYLRQKGS